MNKEIAKRRPDKNIIFEGANVERESECVFFNGGEDLRRVHKEKQRWV